MRRVPFSNSTVAVLPATLAVAALAVAGCQLVAGIENLELTTDAGYGGPVDAPDSEGAAASDGRQGGPAGADAGDATTDGGASLDGTMRTGHSEAAASPGDGAPGDDAPAEEEASTGPDDEASDGSPQPEGASESGAPEPDAETASEDGGDAALSTQLIDDLESDDGHILPVDGRSGSWFTYNDGTDGGVQMPPPPFLPAPTMPPLGSSKFSAETFGMGFDSFAGMGFTLNDPPTGPDAGVMSPYDASAFLGIVFDARVGASSSTRLRVGFPDANTIASGNSFGEFLTLTTQWTQQVVYFSDTTQLNSFGSLSPSIDTSAIFSIIFQMDADGSPVDFDLWIDNVAFITQ